MKLHNPNMSISPKSSHSPQSFHTNNSTFMPFKEASKLISPQIELHLSPENLIPQGDLFKELGFGSENKENAFHQLSVTTCLLTLELMIRSLLQMNLDWMKQKLLQVPSLIWILLSCKKVSTTFDPLEKPHLEIKKTHPSKLNNLM